MTRWVMLADLERCVGCQTCTAACRHANATSPAVQWRKVLDVEAGTYPEVSRTFVPVGCQHCADPPCMHVCPSTATRQRADGIVTIDYDICIGCAYCDVACPYQARFKIDAPRFAYGDVPMRNEIEREEPRRFGVAQKCTFCSDRIDFGLSEGVTPGIDPRATPACVNACIADALHFGDLDDPNSNVSRLLRAQKSFRMHDEIGTEPGFYYLYDKANGAAEKIDDPAPPLTAGELRTKGVEPWHQQHWDWKAAGNFVFGGAGAGLFLFAAIAGAWQASALALLWPGMAAIAFGLFLLLFKIGRPMRFIFVLRQPGRSWMAREAWVAGVFFPLAAWAAWNASLSFASAAAAVGFLFLFCQAMILRAAKGIPTWRTPAVVPLILATGFAEGAGLFLAATAFLRSLAPLAAAAALIALGAAVLRGLAWHAYCHNLHRDGAPSRALAVLAAFRPWFFGLGLVLPAALVAAGFVGAGFGAADATSPLFALAGICICLAGSVLKFVLITRAGYNQGFALTHTPVRGSGLAGPAVKPGWSTQ